jgi:molecular chaperone GrpE
LRQRAELARVGAARAEEEAHRQSRLRESTEAQLEESRRVHQELASDFDRLRQRTRKEAEDAERKGEERALKAFLEVYDNVERARLHQGADLARLADGLRMLVDQFRRQLARLGLERIPAARGDSFDPALHEAVIHVDAPDVAEGTIVDELLAGFRVRGRLFRPARVSVAAPRPADGDEG